MTILTILTKFCLKFANLVNFAISFFLHGDIDNFGDIANIATFAMSFFCFALSALSALSPSKVQIVQIVQCHFFERYVQKLSVSCSYIFLVIR